MHVARRYPMQLFLRIGPGHGTGPPNADTPSPLRRDAAAHR